MKDKLIVKRNMLKVAILCSIMGIAEECFFGFYLMNQFEESNRYVFVIVMCSLAFAILGLWGLLFNSYLKVNNETVTLCKFFSAKKTIVWKNAGITVEDVAYSRPSVEAARSWKEIVICDGQNEIRFQHDDKAYNTIKEYYDNARHYDDNITF